ncbi:UNVERIFIED_CONTAM: hypothetical protein FKN15_025679 [Acipenser sinensis]
MNTRCPPKRVPPAARFFTLCRLTVQLPQSYNAALGSLQASPQAPGQTTGVAGQFVMEHHTLPGQKSHLMAPDHLGGIEFDLQLLWSAQSFDSPYQLWRATSSYSRKDYSGEYSVVIIPCTVQPTQPWIDPGDKPLTCTAHAPEK